MSSAGCPYKVGDYVVYRPVQRGADIKAMAAGSERLEQGMTYRVRAIRDNQYVVVDYEPPSLSLHWTEFVPAPTGRRDLDPWQLALLIAFAALMVWLARGVLDTIARTLG